MPELKQDYELEPQKKDAKIEENLTELPVYMNKIKLSPEQEKRLVDEIMDEIEEIEKERSMESLVDKWDALDNQYEGKIQEDTRLQFNLNRNITKPIVDRVANFIKQGYFESDPVYAISPRPEFAKEGGQDVCDRQQDFLDYKLDNLYFEAPVGKGVLCSVKKGTGILKIFHDIKTVNRHREEEYSGKMSVVGMQGDQIITDSKGLKEFLANWPDAPKDYPGLVKKLTEGKDIRFIAKYKEVVYNDPRIQFVELKNFFVRLATDGYEGLKECRLMAELMNMSYWELKKEEAKGKFENIDDLISDDKGGKIAKYNQENFDFYECSYFFRLNEDDEEETRVLCWIAKDKKKLIGAFYYPYDFGSHYLPLYISKNRNGFYQPGLAEYVTDSNIAQSAILNLILGGMYLQNMVTPITDEGSVTDMQFLEKRWMLGVPINIPKGEKADFLQNHMSPVDVNGGLTMLQFMKGEDEERVQSSSLMSGGQTPLDPNAPASKTIALLKQAGIPIKEYISAMTPSFNEMAYIFLQIYYEASKGEEGLKYRINPERVVGDNPFAVIPRSELAARTTIQAQAYAFDFDKVQAKIEDLGLYKTVRMEPLIAKNPEAVYYLLKTLIKGWTNKWRVMIDKLLPPLEEFKKMQANVALNAVAQYIQAKTQESKMTGAPMQLQAQELMPLIMDLKAQTATEPDEKVLKEQAKQNG